MSKKIKLFLVITILLIISFLASWFYWPNEKQQEFTYLPKSDNYIDYTHFQIEYDSIHQQPLWVAYELNASETIANVERGSRTFKKDPNYPNTHSKSVYSKSKHDLGHIVPARDMQYSEEALNMTFFMTNVSPQKPGFNRGIWKKLENRVRKWAVSDEQIYIVCGPILNDTLPKLKNKISIPDYYYKVILDLEPEKKIIAFLLPNKKSKDALKNYVISVDSLEKLTKIDYFYSLNDEQESRLESEIVLNNWIFE